jgi:hypothetical protein
MIDVISKKCEHTGCETLSCYNYKGKKFGIFCSDHKLDGMIDVKNKTCEHTGCGKQPCYNYKGETTGRFCKEHKLDDMKNVKSKTCENSECETQSCYNYEGKKFGRFCDIHKLDGMKNVISKTCEHLGCEIICCYNYKGKKTGRFCDIHKLDGMINVISKTCHICDTYANRKYRGFCARCFSYTFPNEPMSRNIRTKERHVADFIRNTFPEYTIIFDKPIQDGCSKRRPDIIIDMGTHVLIVEIDEDQHRHYDTTCEITRLNNIVEDLGGRYCVIIRFNPDTYVQESGTKTHSLWSMHKNTGILHINKKRHQEWTTRLDTLKKCILLNMTTIPSEILECEYLYYDMI